MTIPLIPSLLVAVMAAKKTLSKFVLMGLLGLADQFGSSRGARNGKWRWSLSACVSWHISGSLKLEEVT
jgi:hypothetical protein